MMPITLCSIAAYFGLYVPITVAMPRFAASIISFLTTATIHRGISSRLPEAAQSCWLLIWISNQMMFQLILIVFTLTQFGFNKSKDPEVVAYNDNVFKGTHLDM